MATGTLLVTMSEPATVLAAVKTAYLRSAETRSAWVLLGGGKPYGTRPVYVVGTYVVDVGAPTVMPRTMSTATVVVMVSDSVYVAGRINSTFESVVEDAG
jgi:hypothetical protein